MSIKFYCPLGHRLTVPDQRAGKKGRCPTCHQKVIVPVANPRPSGKPKGESGRARKLEDAIEAELGLGLDEPSDGASDGDDDLTPPPQPKRHSHHAAPSPAPSAQSAASPSPPPTPAANPAGELRPPPSPVSNPARPVPVTPPVPPQSPAQLAAAAALSSGTPQPAHRHAHSPTAAEPSPRVRRRQTSWIEPATPDTIEEGYQPDADRLQQVYLLAGGLAGITAFSLSPALHRLASLSQAPGWVQVVAVLTLVQLVYAVWLVTLPDWSTTWVGMLVCAGCATVYGVGMGIILTTAPGRTVALGLTDVRNTAGGWCAVQILLLGFLSYGFGRASTAWQRALQPKAAGR